MSIGSGSPGVDDLLRGVDWNHLAGEWLGGDVLRKAIVGFTQPERTSREADEVILGGLVYGGIAHPLGVASLVCELVAIPDIADPVVLLGELPPLLWGTIDWHDHFTLELTQRFVVDNPFEAWSYLGSGQAPASLVHAFAGLLVDPRPEVRRATAEVAGLFRPIASALLDLIWQRIDVEHDDATRGLLLAAVGLVGSDADRAPVEPIATNDPTGEGRLFAQFAAVLLDAGRLDHLRRFALTSATADPVLSGIPWGWCRGATGHGLGRWVLELSTCRHGRLALFEHLLALMTNSPDLAGSCVVRILRLVAPGGAADVANDATMFHESLRIALRAIVDSDPAWQTASTSDELMALGLPSTRDALAQMVNW